MKETNKERQSKENWEIKKKRKLKKENLMKEKEKEKVSKNLRKWREKLKEIRRCTAIIVLYYVNLWIKTISFLEGNVKKIGAWKERTKGRNEGRMKWTKLKERKKESSD